MIYQRPNYRSAIVTGVSDRQYPLTALELLDPEIDAWECASSISIGCLKLLVKPFHPISFLSKKCDHRSLLAFAHLTLGDVADRSLNEKVDDQGDIEGNNQDHP
jgi:hypothetical protein